MMWDFSGSRSAHEYSGSVPMGMPSPSFPAPVDTQTNWPVAIPNYGEPAFPADPTFLNVPRDIDWQSGGRGHHHKHHHHHHRSHSNPPPATHRHKVAESERQVLIQTSGHHQVLHHHTPVAPHHHAPAEPKSRHSHAPQVVAAPAAHHAHLFQYSKCNGRKKALCIGINYHGQANPLRGCINDARNVRNFLIQHWGFKTEDIVLLSDDSHNPRSQPTRKNILDAMRWLVHGAKKHDSLFFHYSGHGGQTKDLDGDEMDGFDEVIYPVDFRKRGYITDDEMHTIMVRAIPHGCRLTALFDSCHSGTVLDLPYVYSSSGRHKVEHVSKRALSEKVTSSDVISWSGCKDGQTSADTFHDGVAVGAMSYAFITSLNQNPRQSYQGLLKSVRKILYPKFSQKPQLGSSHLIDTSLQFVI